LNIFTLISLLFSWYIKLDCFNFKLFICGLLYSFLCCILLYMLLAFCYPLLCISSFEIETINNDLQNPLSSLELECQVISSTTTFSVSWWEDIGIIKCSKVNSHFYQHFEICMPTSFNSTTFVSNKNLVSINVIGYVGTAPSFFDLIPDPLIYLRASLKSITVVNGKTPTQLMLPNTFINCTGKVRYFDKIKLYIDTPATFGFSGGPCFLQSNPNEWEFIGILLGATKLWNYCILLTPTATYNSYYASFTNKQEL